MNKYEVVDTMCIDSYISFQSEENYSEEELKIVVEKILNDEPIDLDTNRVIEYPHISNGFKTQIYKNGKEISAASSDNASDGQFNINDYAQKYAMHCKTSEAAKEFCDYLHKSGKKWCSGRLYSQENNWEIYKTHTVYCFNEGVYCPFNYATTLGYTILEWENFNKPQESDLLKPKLTEDDNAVISYCKRCGYFYLAKNKDGEIYAFKTKPFKGKKKWLNQELRRNDAFCIKMPVSFLSWEDEVPFYIGD